MTQRRGKTPTLITNGRVPLYGDEPWAEFFEPLLKAKGNVFSWAGGMEPEANPASTFAIILRRTTGRHDRAGNRLGRRAYDLSRAGRGPFCLIELRCDVEPIPASASLIVTEGGCMSVDMTHWRTSRASVEKALLGVLTGIHGLNPSWFNFTQGALMIERTLNIPGDQASVFAGILIHFGKYLRQRGVDDCAAVAVEQKGDDVVVLTVVPGTGEPEAIERSLSDYSLILSGAREPEATLGDPTHVMELKQKLRMANVDLQNTRELLQIHKNRNLDLQNSIQWHQELTLALAQDGHAKTAAIATLANTLQESVATVLSRFAQEYGPASTTAKALNNLAELATTTRATQREAEGIFRLIRAHDPGVLSRLWSELGLDTPRIAELALGRVGAEGVLSALKVVYDTYMRLS